MKKLLMPPIFTDNMVLQRNKNIVIRGEAAENSEITVTLKDITLKTTSFGSEWEVIFPPMEAEKNLEMQVSDGTDTLAFKNIAIGEVWLAGGQSNMEFELEKVKDAEQEIEMSEGTDIRFYNVPHLSYMDEEYFSKERQNFWQECGRLTSGKCSAVGYFYAKYLTEKLGVTVGIIGCNWGGTSASVWQDRQRLEMDSQLKVYIDDYKKAMEGKSFEEYCEELKEFEKWYEVWNKKVGELYAENPDIEWEEVIKIAGENRWPEPLGPKSPYRAGGLYETMLKRVAPYSIRGVIYYQGEEDAQRAEIYYKLLKSLIECWRELWNDDRLPFMIVQLPMFMNKGEPDYKNWCVVRQAQARVHETVKNTGLAVILDCGEYGNIHPVDKKPVGERLALQALYHTYGFKDTDAYPPIFDTVEYRNGGILVKFRYAQNGFEVRGDLTGFELSSDGIVYEQAAAEIIGSDIFVKSGNVENPVHIRYAWTNYSQVCLFGRNGIPVMPFCF